MALEASHSREHTNLPCQDRQRNWRYLRSKRSVDTPLVTLKERLRDSKFAAKGRSLLPSWLQPRHSYDRDESFIPCPKVTFLIDRPPPLVCQICRETRFRLRSPADDGTVNDTTFSIFPCGHVAGTQGLETWCYAYGTCPFCRLELRYPGCGHRIPPRHITHESIHVLPRTLPDGGVIPELCTECLKTNLVAEAEDRFATAAHKFREVRRRVQRTGDPGDEQQLLRMKEEIETVMRDQVHLRYLSSLLSAW